MLRFHLPVWWCKYVQIHTRVKGYAKALGINRYALGNYASFYSTWYYVRRVLIVTRCTCVFAITDWLLFGLASSCYAHTYYFSRYAKNCENPCFLRQVRTWVLATSGYLTFKSQFCDLSSPCGGSFACRRFPEVDGRASPAVGGSLNTRPSFTLNVNVDF